MRSPCSSRTNILTWLWAVVLIIILVTIYMCVLSGLSEQSVTPLSAQTSSSTLSGPPTGVLSPEVVLQSRRSQPSKNLVASRHLWVRVGQHFTPDPNGLGVDLFPPFKEEPRYVPVVQYPQSPVLWRPSDYVVKRKYERSQEADPKEFARLFKEFVTILEHYHVRYWICEVHDPYLIRTSVCVDWFHIWVLDWISKVYNKKTNGEFVLDINQHFRFWSPPPVWYSLENAGVFRNTAETQGLAIHACSFAGYDKLAMAMWLDEWNHTILETAPQLCFDYGQCSANDSVFPLHRWEWLGTQTWITHIHWTRITTSVLYRAQSFLSYLNPLSYFASSSSSSYVQTFVSGPGETPVRHLWCRIGEPCDGQCSCGEIGRTRFPPFREEARYLPKNVFLKLLPGFKFFNEASGHHQHLDRRYYSGQNFTVEETQRHLRALFQEFSDLMNHYRVPYFLDGGSLLGWFWNEKPLPWDDDIDIGIQWYYLFVLQWISKVYSHPDFELLVNPHFIFSDYPRGGQNIIDARMICKKTGVFIDIVSYACKEDDLYTERLFLDEASPKTVTSGGVILDKRGRKVRSSTLFPVRPAQWNGIPTWVPNDYFTKLVDAYGPSSVTVFGERVFDRKAGVWVLKDAVDSASGEDNRTKVESKTPSPASYPRFPLHGAASSGETDRRIPSSAASSSSSQTQLDEPSRHQSAPARQELLEWNPMFP